MIMKKNLPFFAALFILIFSQTVRTATETETGVETVLRKAQTALAAEDFEAAYNAYQSAAQAHGNALAQFNLGLFYQNGWGREIDHITACHWFEKSAAQGISAAQHFTGLCVEQGLHRTADLSQAASLYQEAAKAGYFSSYCDLGRLYMNGEGVEKNPNLALELCRSAATLGSPVAQNQMGRFLLEGDSSIRNPIDAISWFEAAARQQSPEAFYYLGLIAQQGLLQPHAPDKARQLFETAATLKFIPAYFQTGKLYFHADPDPDTGYLSPEHIAKAYLWLSVAIQRSKNAEEIETANLMLKDAIRIMPENWLKDLNPKITLFLQENR